MRFLCDVHISYKLKNLFSQQGFEALHVNEILDKWHTKDVSICSYADENNFIVVTKHFDFIDFYYLRKSPKKLIKINLGNISTNDLIQIFKKFLSAIQQANNKERFLIELDKSDGVIADYNISL